MDSPDIEISNLSKLLELPFIGEAILTGRAGGGKDGPKTRKNKTVPPLTFKCKICDVETADESSSRDEDSVMHLAGLHLLHVHSLNLLQYYRLFHDKRRWMKGSISECKYVCKELFNDDEAYLLHLREVHGFAKNKGNASAHKLVMEGRMVTGYLPCTRCPVVMIHKAEDIRAHLEHYHLDFRPDKFYREILDRLDKKSSGWPRDGDSKKEDFTHGNLKEKKEMDVDEQYLLSLTKHRCFLCWDEVDNSSQAIQKHAEDAHGVDIAKYTRVATLEVNENKKSQQGKRMKETDVNNNVAKVDKKKKLEHVEDELMQEPPKKKPKRVSMSTRVRLETPPRQTPSNATKFKTPRKTPAVKIPIIKRKIPLDQQSPEKVKKNPLRPKRVSTSSRKQSEIKIEAPQDKNEKNEEVAKDDTNDGQHFGTCPDCSFTTTSPETLRTHALIEHKIMVNVTWPKKKTIGEHESVVVEPALKTNDSGKVPLKAPDLRLTWYNGCVYKCDACFYLTASPKTISHHIRYKHGLPLHKGQVNNHMIKSEDFECQVCDIVVPKISEKVTQHLKRHHGLSRDQYEKKFILETETKEEEEEKDEEAPAEDANVRRSKRKMGIAADADIITTEKEEEAVDEGISEEPGTDALVAEVNDEVDHEKIL